MAGEGTCFEYAAGGRVSGGVEGEAVKGREQGLGIR
jgi:hypothetical protein